MPLEEDLYKSLLDESKWYREKVGEIWLQKLTMLGVMIGFVATQSSAGAKGNSMLMAAAILSLPLIAILLDIRLAGFVINANVVDHFIMRNYPHPPVLGNWERTKWGSGSDPADRVLTRLRSISVVVITVVPTCIIAFLSAALAEQIGRGMATPNPANRILADGQLRVLVIGFCLLYVALGSVLARATFRR